MITENTMLYSTLYHTAHLTVQHNRIILILEPSNRIRLSHFLRNTNLTPAVLALRNSSTRPCENDIKVHYPLEPLSNVNATTADELRCEDESRYWDVGGG